jgi:GTPase SAR1 family protein
MIVLISLNVITSITSTTSNLSLESKLTMMLHIVTTLREAKNAGENEVPWILVGNKIDLEAPRQVSDHEAEQVAR